MCFPSASHEIDFVQRVECDVAWEAYDKTHEFYLQESWCQSSWLDDPGTSDTIPHDRNDVEIVVAHTV